MKKFVADFETSTWVEDETWVWAWAVCDIETEEIKIGTEIDEFINFCKGEKNCQVYLHNLKFDRRIHHILAFNPRLYSRN